jgi:hypothetical protein
MRFDVPDAVNIRGHGRKVSIRQSGMINKVLEVEGGSLAPVKPNNFSATISITACVPRKTKSSSPFSPARFSSALK